MAVVSLYDLMTGEDSGGFWEVINYKGGHCIRPTSNTRMLFNGVRKELIRTHIEGQAHGNLNAHNITFPHNDIRHPRFTNATGGDGFMADYPSLANILMDAVAHNNPSHLDFDPETREFIYVLRHPPPLARKSLLDRHFWYGSWRDRANLFVGILTFSYVAVQHLKPWSSPIRIPVDFRSSSSMKLVFNDAKKKFGSRFSYGKEMADLMRFIRDYLIHGPEVTHYNSDEADLCYELFTDFPDLMNEIARAFFNRGMGNLILLGD